LAIDGTQIRNNGSQKFAYYFKIFVADSVAADQDGDHEMESEEHGQRFEEIYCSRKTILDRPCWRDDQVSVPTTKQLRVEVYAKSGSS